MRCYETQHLKISTFNITATILLKRSQCGIAKLQEMDMGTPKGFFLKEPNGGSTFEGCSCGIPYTDGIPCHHMVAVVKLSRIEGLTATNSMPVWWTTECWCNQYLADTNETCHFDMDTLRSTLEDAVMRYCPPYAAPRKAGRPKNNKCMKSLLEGKIKRREKLEKTTL